jgi:hypothetical protein
MSVPSDSQMAMASDLWDYLRLGQEVRPAECILVFGGHDLGVARRAVELYRDSVARIILVSGGSAHVPAGSKLSTEADAIFEVLVSRGVSEKDIMVERLASNTSENFWLSAELLRDRHFGFNRFLIVQKPYAERRTIATARRRWPAQSVRVTSEEISFGDYCVGEIPVPRILSMISGEVIRLSGYARSGLIELDEPVPENLLDDARKLQQAGFNARAISSRHAVAPSPANH